MRLDKVNDSTQERRGKIKSNKKNKKNKVNSSKRDGKDVVKLDRICTWSEYAKDNNLVDVADAQLEASVTLNDKVSLYRGDSTKLKVDAIVNAANKSLLGGGGIDGAIHRAAGSDLRKECAGLNGCEMGKTKITKGYNLPADYVLHTVGPIGENEPALRSCYETCLSFLGKDTGKKIRSVAFCGISTGIYGYPLEKAANVALGAVRQWLETGDNAKNVDRIIFVVFLERELETYQRLMSEQYFPVFSERATKENEKDTWIEGDEEKHGDVSNEKVEVAVTKMEHGDPEANEKDEQIVDPKEKDLAKEKGEQQYTEEVVHAETKKERTVDAVEEVEQHTESKEVERAERNEIVDRGDAEGDTHNVEQGVTEKETSHEQKWR